MGTAESASDAELLAAASVDGVAFERVYRRYVRRVSAFAAARCSSPEDVADVVAETFARLLDAADRYDPARGEPAAFVFGIAAHVVQDLHRHRSRDGAPLPATRRVPPPAADRRAGHHDGGPEGPRRRP